MVTGRSHQGEFGGSVLRALEYAGVEIPVVFAAMKWKRQAAREHGWIPDVWIDDMPEYIGPQDALLIGPKLTASA